MEVSIKVVSSWLILNEHQYHSCVMIKVLFVINAGGKHVGNVGNGLRMQAKLVENERQRTRISLEASPGAIRLLRFELGGINQLAE